MIGRRSGHTRLSLLRLLLSYIVILIPVILANVAIFLWLFIPAYENEIQSVNDNVLRILAMELDSGITDTVSDLYRDIILDRHSRHTMDPVVGVSRNDLWPLYETYRYLRKETTVYNDLLHGISIWYLDARFINSSAGYQYLDDEPRNSLSFDWFDVTDLSDYGDAVHIPDVALFKNSRDLVDVISIRIPVPMRSDPGGRRAVISFNIRNSFIEDVLTRSRHNTGYDFTVLNNAGEVLFATSEEGLTPRLTNSIDDLKHGVVQTTSPGMISSAVLSSSRLWYYVYSVPESEYFGKSRALRYQIIISGLVCLAIAVVLSFVTSRRVYSPIHDIAVVAASASGLTEHGRQRPDDFSIITNSLSLLSSRAEDLSRTLAKFRPSIVNDFFSDLLRGNLSDVELEERTAFLDLSFPGRFWKVVVVEPAGGDTKPGVDTQVLEIIDAIERSNSDRFFCYPRYRDKLGVTGIACFRHEGAFSRMVSDIVDRLRDHPSAIRQFSVASGRTYEDIRSVADSYQEAREMLGYRFLYDGVYLDADSFSPEAGRIDFADGERIRVFLNSLDRNMAEEFLTTVESKLKRYGAHDEVTREHTGHILSITRFCLKNSRWDADFGWIDERLNDCWHAASFRSFRKLYLSLVSELVRADERNRSQSMERLISDVQAYIHENIADRDLSLGKAAEKFRISYSYLSTWFKEVTGKNFSQYTISCRLRHAEQLLISTNDTVDQIARLSGFRHAGYFIRQFKKHAGSTPRQYRLRMSVSQKSATTDRF